MAEIGPNGAPRLLASRLAFEVKVMIGLESKLPDSHAAKVGLNCPTD